jgi:predicted ATPase/DNA-binding SARP family transcriptional activator
VGLPNGHDEPVTGFGYDKVRALLAYVATESRHPHSRESLAALLWPESDSNTARTNLRKALSTLRAAIGDEDASPPFLILSGDTVQLNPEGNCWLDVDQLKGWLDASSNHAHPQFESCDSCIHDLEATAALYQGSFLQGLLVDSLEFEAWALTMRENLHTRVLTALHDLTQHYLHNGEYGLAQKYALRQVELEPYREEAHRALMHSLSCSGQRSAALAQYETCRRILANELGVEPSAETQAFYKRIRSAGEARPHNLPAQQPLVGRQAELHEIGRLLANPDCRLLTLVGPGGIGKTSLALQSAREYMGDFLHGAFWAPLASLRHPDQILTAIVNALPIIPGSDPETQLLDYLREKSLLLVLDNFEHLIPSERDRNDTALQWVNKILQSAPHVKLLITSRERLSLRAEWIIRVEGLPHPSDLAAVDASTLPDYAAIQLFVRRARQLIAGFPRQLEVYPQIARICKLVSGIPLGIELASGWVDQLTCQAIADRIETDLDFLVTSLRDAPDRHRSLRAVFDHSWKLLSTEEQAVLRKLSVFQTPFDQAAARQVSGAFPRQLAALANKSFLHSDTFAASSQSAVGTRLSAGAAGRYTMHPLLKQYLVEELAAHPAEDTHTRLGHAEHFAHFLKEREPALVIQHKNITLDEVGAAIADVQAAWDWAIAQKAFHVLDHLLDGLYIYFWERNQFREGKATLEKAVEALDRTVFVRACSSILQNQMLLARLWSRLAEFVSWLGDLTEAERLARQSVISLQRLANNEELTFSLDVLGRVRYWQGDYSQSRQALTASIESARLSGSRHHLAQALSALASVICDENADYETAHTLYTESLALYQALDNPIGIAKVLINQGAIFYESGDYPQAQRLYQRSLEIYRQADYPYGISAALNNLAIVTRKMEDFENAKKLIEESLALKRETGNRVAILHALLEIGALSAEMGDYTAARGHFCEALQMALETHSRGLLFDIVIGFAELHRKKGEAIQAAEIVAWVLAQGGVGQEANAEAEALRAKLEKSLTSDELAQCVQRASEKDIHRIAAELTAYIP